MIQNYLERTYHLRTSDFDMRNRIFPAAVLDLFQDTAGEHATSLGVGYYDLRDKKLCWMLSRVRYEVLRQPAIFSDVTVRTWPVESKRIEFDRDYTVFDKDGQSLIKGSSQWVILDITDREHPKIVPARGFDLGVDEYITERAIERPFPRFVPNFTTDSEPYFTRSGYTDIDTNGHVNNIKYSNFILNALDLPAECEISSFRLDFIKEILDGDRIKVTYAHDGSDIICKGESGTEDASVTNFIARLTVK